MLRPSVHGPITQIQLARTILGRPLYTVSAFLVDGLLIDSGLPHTALELVSWLRDQQVHQVINTHHHEDHSGGNGPIWDVLGLPLAAPSATVPILANFPRLELYRRIVWGQPKDAIVQALDGSVETEHYRFQLIPTPGHCPDHTCFFEPVQGWLFSGDLFIHERARYLRRDEDLKELIESLQQILALQPKLLACSHAGLVRDASRGIQRKIAYWDQLHAQARGLRRSGHSAREITNSLLGREGRMTWISRGHVSKINLTRALLRLDP